MEPINIGCYGTRILDYCGQVIALTKVILYKRSRTRSATPCVLVCTRAIGSSSRTKWLSATMSADLLLEPFLFGFIMLLIMCPKDFAITGLLMLSHSGGMVLKVEGCSIFSPLRVIGRRMCTGDYMCGTLACYPFPVSYYHQTKPSC